MVVSVFSLPVSDPIQIQKTLTEVAVLQRSGQSIPVEVQDWADYANNVLDTIIREERL